MRYRFLTCDVFTARRFGGNQLAVLPDAGGLDTAAMQRIAAEFNYSETTFVLPPTDPANLARVRIFTPRSEMPFAGHPTVGTALALAWLGRTRLAASSSSRRMPGRSRQACHGRAKALNAEFTAPEASSHSPAIEARRGGEALGLAVDQIVVGGRPAVRGVLRRAVSSGRACQPRGPGPCRARQHRALPAVAAEGVFLFTRDGGGCRGRICAPACLRRRTGSRGPGHGQRRRGAWRASSASGPGLPKAGTPGGSPRASRWAGRA